jgi:hypothetical protein
VVTGNAPTAYNVCVYNGTTVGTSRLIANTVYTAAPQPTVLTITPGAGSSLGGDTVTVTGTGFPTTAGAIKATLGGAALTSIVPIDSTTFTATTPQHAGELDVPLVVTTDNGAATKTAAYDYLNGISISPNTASNANDGVWVDVRGVGFESLAFDTLGFNDPSAVVGAARVWLVDAEGGACTGTSPIVCAGTAYAPGNNSDATFDATGGPTAECGAVAVISGNELFCRLDLHTGGLDPADASAQTAGAAAVVPNGTYTLTVVNTGDPDADPADVTQNVISSGSTFTVSDF